MSIHENLPRQVRHELKQALGMGARLLGSDKSCGYFWR